MSLARALAAAVSLSLAGAAYADDEAAALAGIRALLADMSEAVESEDIGAYLSHISPRDTTFLTEQRNWAADLRRHPVHEFEMTLSDAGDLELSEHGWAVAEVRMRWQTAEFEPRRDVRFDARFEPAGFADGAWFYAGEHWTVVADDRHGAPCRAMAPEGLESVALQIVEVLPGVRERVDAMFGITNDREVQVKVYPTMEHLQASIYLSYEDPLGGWNEPGESIKLLAGPSLRARNLRRLLGHEYGHAATFTMGERVDDAPWWALEGVAELAADTVADHTSQTRARMVRSWAADDNLRTWAQLSDFRGEAASHAQWVYLQGWSMLAYVTQRFGDSGRNDWVRLLARGEPLATATARALGVRFEDLDADWRASLADDPGAADDDAGETTAPAEPVEVEPADG